MNLFRFLIGTAPLIGRLEIDKMTALHNRELGRDSLKRGKRIVRIGGS